MTEQTRRQDPTIAAFQHEDQCRQDVDAASYRCICAVDADSLKQLETDHRDSVGRWLDAVQATRTAHIRAESDSARSDDRQPRRLLK